MFNDPETPPGADWFAEIHPEDRERVRDVFRETITTGVGQRCEFRLELNGRAVRYLEFPSTTR